ncbi:MAG: hypothetical protein K0R29_387 [Pseudobdellovibrio sp.]|jgi:hypothetical protein|nr:hypothetical protein [Pseudobdellovibrio sp.]
MKSLLVLASLVLGTVAQANVQREGVINFNVIKADYAKSHVRNPGAAQVSVDYKNSTVTLTIEEKHKPCPAGMMCAAVMPAPVQIELPIVKVETDSCGVKHVVAKRDLRPVDGALQVLKVVDPTLNITCLISEEASATYESRFYSRMTSQEIVALSKLTLALDTLESVQPLETSLAPAILVKMVIHPGFVPVPALKTIYVDVTGRVISAVQVYRNGLSTPKVTVLAQLTEQALKNLNEVVAAIPADAKLVDLQAGEPMCTDAPSTEVVVTVNGKDVVVHHTSGCHEFSIQDYRAQMLKELMEGFQNLTK